MRSEIRHLLMRRRAYEDRMRRQEAHLIGLRNEVRSFAGGDPIEDPYDTSPASNGDEEELQAFKYRMRSNGIVDWEEDLTT